MSWIEEELETINLGDKRLNKRAIKITESLGFAPGKTIPQSFKTWGEIKACYNFFNNELVSHSKLLAPHFEQTITRISEYPVVLLHSDTTDINYSSKNAMEGKQRLSNHQNGIWLHATLASTPERLPLGMVEVNFWNRKLEVMDKNSNSYAHDIAPIEEKESYRWLKSYIRACEIARETPETQIINITDREGDIIEIFCAAEEQSKQSNFAYYIIRSNHDRLVDDDGLGTKEINKKLKQRLKESDSIGELEFTISSAENRKARKVKQQIKAVTVTLKSKHKKFKAKVNVVMAIEEKPPKGESPLIWIFITNLPINSFQDVSKVISFYLCRWDIELFFKVLKSGCKIEERQLQTTDRMKILISIFMILAWRVMFTMMLGRIHSEMSTTDIFEEAEWKAVFKIINPEKRLPRKAPRLGDFIIMIATLGGYIKGAEPPGVKTMWKGMARMVDFSIAWEAFR